jgi:hypothetical protein
MILERYLVHDGHMHHFVVTLAEAGWDVREEEDSLVVHQAHHDDWHRVERVLQRFARAAEELERAGWVERALAGTPID